MRWSNLYHSSRRKRSKRVFINRGIGNILCPTRSLLCLSQIGELVLARVHPLKDSVDPAAQGPNNYFSNCQNKTNLSKFVSCRGYHASTSPKDFLKKRYNSPHLSKATSRIYSKEVMLTMKMQLMMIMITILLTKVDIHFHDEN